MLPPRVLARTTQVALVALCFASGVRSGLAQPGAPARAGRAVVLIALPAVDAETQGELRDALLAQFALLPADPRIENDPQGAAGTSLGQRMSNAQARGAELGAIAVFWIDPQPDGRWLLHMMDSESERILVRAVDARDERRQAAIEAVAVMVRESTRALIEGLPVTEAVPPEPKPTAEAGPGPAAPPETDRAPGTGSVPQLKGARPVRIGIGYHADEFAEDHGVQSGAVISAGWLGLAPFYIAASFALTQRVEVNTAELEFEVTRLPFGLGAGYRLRLGGVVALDFELGGILELLRGTDPRPGDGYLLDRPTATNETLFGLAARVRAELFAVPTISLFATLGLDTIFNNFHYTTKELRPDPNEMTVLSLWRFRPVAEVGLAFYP